VRRCVCPVAAGWIDGVGTLDPALRQHADAELRKFEVAVKVSQNG
jgi:hypothetical protein